MEPTNKQRGGKLRCVSWQHPMEWCVLLHIWASKSFSKYFYLCFMYVHIYVDACTLPCQRSSSITLHLIVWDSISLSTQGSLFWLNSLSSELPGPTGSCFPSSGLIGTHSHAQLFYEVQKAWTQVPLLIQHLSGSGFYIFKMGITCLCQRVQGVTSSPA